MEHRDNSFLETEKIGTLMRKYAVPCIISLLVAALYNIVDQIFIANASYLGSYGNAANSAVFPLTMVALALAVMVGDGCCAFVSICLGGKRMKDANRSVGSAITLCIAISIVLTIIYLVFQEPILTFFGGHVNEQTFVLGKEYFFWITVGVPFYMFGQCLNPIIRSDGSPKFAMVATVGGAMINLVLDPLFIYGFHMGMMGAAVATVAGQIFTAALSVWYLLHAKILKVHTGDLVPAFGLIKKFIPLGITSFLSQISVVVSMAAVNNMIVKYGALDPIFGQTEYAQIPLAVVGIVMKFFQIVIAISVGLAAGCIPVVGYNVGAGRFDRAKALFKNILGFEFLIGLIALLIVQFFPVQLIGIFGAANESTYYTEFAVKVFRIYLCMLPLATVNKGTFIYLQSLGKAVQSSLLSVVREVVFGVGFVLILPRIFALDGVLYSMPVADFLTFLITVILVIRIFRELDEKMQPKAA